MSEAPISIIMAGNPPTDPQEEDPAEKADAQVSAEKAKSPHANASPPPGRAVRSTRRRSAPIVDQFSDPEEEALAHERPGEGFIVFGARPGNGSPSMTVIIIHVVTRDHILRHMWG